MQEALLASRGDGPTRGPERQRGGRRKNSRPGTRGGAVKRKSSSAMKHENDENVVSIGNLNFETTLGALRKHVKGAISSGFGQVTIGERADGRSTGKATVIFRVREDADDAASALNGTELDGRTLTARLLGGGGGGGGGGAKKKVKKGPVTAGALDAELDDYKNANKPKTKKGGKTADDLEAELDAYMQGDKPTAAKKGQTTADDLDAELDAYNAAATKEIQTPGKEADADQVAPAVGDESAANNDDAA